MVLVNNTTATVSGNTSTNQSGSTIFVGLGNNGLTIQNNSLDSGFRGVRFSTAYGTGLNQNIQILNNTITNMGDAGILVPVGTVSDQVTVTGNQLVGNVIGVSNDNTSPLVNAVHNWWGDASGPGVVASGTGDKVSANVTYSPWCTNAACTTFYTLPVHDVTQDTYFSTIQAAVDAAANGDVIDVAAGTYVENVVVDKSVTIAGAGVGNTIVLPAVSNPNPCTGSSLCGGAASNVFLVQADNVVIHDLTVDGDNPALTAGYDQRWRKH